jgi:hypothetical protein
MNKIVIVVCIDSDRLGMYRQVLSSIAGTVLTAVSFETAREMLKQTRPDVLVTEIRLKEYNGLHLALWTRMTHPGVRIILVGGSDHVLEADARIIDAMYVQQGDMQAVHEAALEALSREHPRRRWRRRAILGEYAMHVGDRPVRVVDVSYGGVCFEVDSALPARAQVPISVPRFGVQAEATCVWMRESETPGAQICGAALPEDQLGVGSSWRAFVDAVSTPPPASPE